MAYVTDEHDNLVKIKTDGFTKSSLSASVMQLKANYDINMSSNIDDARVQEILIKKLIEEAYKQNIIDIHSLEDYSQQKTKYQAELNIVKPGTRFQNVINDTFTVQGEMFTEADLIKAIRIAYPERFI